MPSCSAGETEEHRWSQKGSAGTEPLRARVAPVSPGGTRERVTVGLGVHFLYFLWDAERIM